MECQILGGRTDGHGSGTFDIRVPRLWKISCPGIFHILEALRGKSPKLPGFISLAKKLASVSALQQWLNMGNLGVSVAFWVVSTS